MIPEQIVKLAIEKGGYNQYNWDFGYNVLLGKSDEAILLDPLFWQALGKWLGWPEESHNADYYGCYCTYCRWLSTATRGLNSCWQQLALRYFELVLTGGDVYKFWEELIKK